MLAFCSPTQTLAQVAGDVASYNSSGAVGHSNQYIDAAAFPNSDICQKIYAAFSGAPRSGAVLDARGINASSLLTCSSTETPWYNGSSYHNVPATILLPAGTITISLAWTLPNGTKLIGEGPSKTIIQTNSSTGITSGPMIIMGTSSGSLACPTAGCTGVEVQDLALSVSSGSGPGLTGIQNENSGDLSFVRNVSLTNFAVYGLQISGSGAQNSGPYTDISYTTTSAVSNSSATECVNISGAATRGIQGLTCNTVSPGGPLAAAVEIEASDNLLQDVAADEGFVDGVLIGSTSTTANVVLENIAGGHTNTVEIGADSEDITILAVASQGGKNTILDDLTGGPTLTDKTVALYAVGEPVKSGSTKVGYTRFTTSLNMPTWAAFSQALPTPPSGSCVSGSILTNSAGIAGSTSTVPTMWVCTGGSWAVVPI